MSPISQHVRILVLDRDASAASRFAAVLQQAGYSPSTQSATSEHDFSRALSEFAPDVVLANHAGDPFDAVAAQQIVLDAQPGVPLILLVEQLDEAAAVRALRAGIEDIVHVGRLERLPGAVESALAVRRKLQLLSPRQLEVLRGVAMGLTTREIAKRMKISVKTVETHRSALMKRLEMHEVATLVRYAVRVALVPSES